MGATGLPIATARFFTALPRTAAAGRSRVVRRRAGVMSGVYSTVMPPTMPFQS